MGDALLKRACIIPAFLDYNMLVVNFKGMEEELFLCEGGGEIDWDMGSFMWDAEGGAELLFRWDGWCMGFREFMSDAEFGAELLFRWDGWCIGFREFMSDAEFGAGAPFPLDLISLWVE